MPLVTNGYNTREMHKGKHGINCLCAWCGKPLFKNNTEIEPHFFGASLGYCYCQKCFKSGKQSRDYKELTLADLHKDKSILWSSPKRNVI